MFNFFNSNVFIEIGEAIGNVGKVIKKRGDPELVEGILKRRLAEALHLTLPMPDETVSQPDESVIEGSFRVLSEREQP